MIYANDFKRRLSRNEKLLQLFLRAVSKDLEKSFFSLLHFGHDFLFIGNLFFFLATRWQNTSCICHARIMKFPSDVKSFLYYIAVSPRGGEKVKCSVNINSPSAFISSAGETKTFFLVVCGDFPLGHAGETGSDEQR